MTATYSLHNIVNIDARLLLGLTGPIPTVALLLSASKGFDIDLFGLSIDQIEDLGRRLIDLAGKARVTNSEQGRGTIIA